MNEQLISLREFIPALIYRATQSSCISPSLLLMLTYLCDWHSCVRYKRKITNVVWRVSRRGLSDLGLEDFIRQSNDLFSVDDIKEEIKCSVKPSCNLPEPINNVVDKVCELYQTYKHSGLPTFVFSTYPILSSTSLILEEVDLLKKAEEYELIKQKDS